MVLLNRLRHQGDRAVGFRRPLQNALNAATGSSWRLYGSRSVPLTRRGESSRFREPETESFGLGNNAPEMMHGLSGESLSYVAETHAEDAAAMGSSTDLMHSGELLDEINPETGEATGRVVRRVAAPVSDRMLGRDEMGKVLRGKAGEYERPRDPQLYHTSHSEMCLRAENKLAGLLTSPMHHNDKCEAVVKLLGEVEAEGLHLRASSFSDAATLLMATRYVPSVPFPHTTTLLAMYHNMKRIAVAPTAAVIEYVMVCLSRSAGEGDEGVDVKGLHIATRLFQDADKFMVLPSRTTYTAYFDLCARHGAMDLAVRRYADAVQILHIPPSAEMAASIVSGLNSVGLAEEAIAFVGQLEGVDMTIPLLNASFEAMLSGSDGYAVLSAYESMRRVAGTRNGLIPTADTLTLVLLACEKTGSWQLAKSVLHDMQQLGIRGDETTLNLLLKGLMILKLDSYAEQLYLSMVNRGVAVWEQVEGGVQDSAKRNAALIRRAAATKELLRASQHPLDARDEEEETSIESDHVASAGIQEVVASGQEADDDDAMLEELLSNEPSEEELATRQGTSLSASPNEPIDRPSGDTVDEPLQAQTPKPGRHRGTPKKMLQPRSEEELKRIAANDGLRRVDPEVLMDFLRSKGKLSPAATIGSQKGQVTRNRIISLTHKAIFGVWPVYRSGHIVPK